MEKALLRAQHKDRVLGKVMAWRKNNRAKRCSLRVLAEKIGATLGESDGVPQIADKNDDAELKPK